MHSSAPHFDRNLVKFLVEPFRRPVSQTIVPFTPVEHSIKSIAEVIRINYRDAAGSTRQGAQSKLFGERPVAQHRHVTPSTAQGVRVAAGEGSASERALRWSLPKTGQRPSRG